MATSASSSNSPRRWASQTGVSNYDRVAGLLLALLALLGLTVTLLFLVWLTTILQFKTKAVPVEYIPELGGRGAAAAGVARDLEEPGMEELADVQEPQISDTLEAVTDAASSVSGAIEAVEGNAALMGSGSGLGDSRAEGPGGEGDSDGVPEAERWQIKWSTNSRQAYAQQLDFFKIHLGLIGGGQARIDYASDLSSAKPKTYSVANGSQEKRLYFNYAGGPMRDLDLSLLEAAGLKTKGREPLQFFPPETTARLLQIELAKAGRPLEEIRKTVFGVRGSAGSYEFYVIEQTLGRPRG
ncbi:hypothetical protein [Lignipirellula cremea]|uniref:Uncharacterized protein n=1 Tax=Lignipirellula cremea TaxID=2528010 RepID=A0A518DMQ0_9BACT|nr:hypothetical protein [Lignipirellula cremea]QDU93091.1 hypothetical protein Pla8534_08700 [Lignipirellula cremea]